MRPHGIYGAVKRDFFCFTSESKIIEVVKIEPGRGFKRYLQQMENALLFCKRFKTPTFSQFSPWYFFENSTASYVDSILRLKDRKNSMFRNVLFCFICILLVTETWNTRVFPYINIGHHTSSNTDRLEILWRTKAHGILLFYPKTTIDKKDYKNCFQNLQKAKQLTATTSTSKTNKHT